VTAVEHRLLVRGQAHLASTSMTPSRTNANRIAVCDAAERIGIDALHQRNAGQHRTRDDHRVGRVLTIAAGALPSCPRLRSQYEPLLLPLPEGKKRTLPATDRPCHGWPGLPDDSARRVDEAEREIFGRHQRQALGFALDDHLAPQPAHHRGGSSSDSASPSSG
jgi:hypothetical protein